MGRFSCPRSLVGWIGWLSVGGDCFKVHYGMYSRIGMDGPKRERIAGMELRTEPGACVAFIQFGFQCKDVCAKAKVHSAGRD